MGLLSPRRSFKTLFCAQDGGVLLKSAAIAGSLQTSGIRSIAWIYFLGTFTEGRNCTEELYNEITKNRVQYQELVQHHITDPRSAQDEDPTVNNPLSLVEDSPWAKFFQNAELEKLINQDIERCYPDKEFFQQPFVRNVMARILFIYAKVNHSLSYRQGMHELLAPIIYVLHQERKRDADHIVDPDDYLISLSPSEVTTLEMLLDFNALEADAYFVFNNLMQITGDWFAPIPPTSPSYQKSTNNGVSSSSSSHEEEAATPVVQKCRKIQHTLLKNKDPELHDHLAALKIEPQFYLLRWVRLLLGREFHSLDDLTLIWDAVFAHSPDLVLVDYICVAMLVYIRAQLLERDSTGCLTRLMKYPPVEDVRIFIEQAHTLIFNRMQKPHQSPSIPTTTALSPTIPSPQSSSHSPPPTNTHIKVKSKKQSPKASSWVKALRPIPPMKHNLNVDLNSIDVSMLQEQTRTLIATQLAVATRIDIIVQSIQQTLTTSGDKPDVDALFVSLAELKQTKDILLGFLPITETAASKEEENEHHPLIDHPLSR